MNWIAKWTARLRQRYEPFAAVLLSFAATWAFFCEYLPPLKRVHLVFDIDGYHYPLLQYAFASLKRGRFPEWDAAMYCGIPLAGNIQAALFYPPNWVLFACNLHREHLSFNMLQGMVFIHLWVGFLLCYGWLRAKHISKLPGIIGGAVFSFSGYALSQSQHLGVITGYIWIPLALWGIDQAAARHDWRPLWKTAAASALCFLAGYPAAWLAFGLITAAYAIGIGGWRMLPRAGAAIAASLAISAVQLLPSIEASRLMTPEPKYGWGIKTLSFYATYTIPNYYDFAKHPNGPDYPVQQYLYIGGAAIFAVLWLAGRRFSRSPSKIDLPGGVPGFSRQLAACAITLAASLLWIANPYDLIGRAVRALPFIRRIAAEFNFLPGLTIAVAFATALSLNDFLRRPERRWPFWFSVIPPALLAGWATRLFRIWLPGGPELNAGAASALDALIMATLVGGTLFVLRSEAGFRRAVLAAVLVVSVGVEYKVFGTSRAFNSAPGSVDSKYRGSMIGMDAAVFAQLKANPEYRIALDDSDAPIPAEFRHFDLATPQGFDPLLPGRYKSYIESGLVSGRFRTNRLFDIDPTNADSMLMLGARYYVTRPGQRFYELLRADERYKLLEPSDTFYRVFEYLHARPAYWWASSGRPEGIERRTWLPEMRELLVRREYPDQIVFAEQAYPGWRAMVDGRPVHVARWNDVFQIVDVPAGEHLVQFEFRSSAVRMGALISAFSVLFCVGCAVLRVRRRRV